MPSISIPAVSGPPGLDLAAYPSGRRRGASVRPRRDDLALLATSRSLAPKDSAPALCRTAVSKGRTWLAEQSGKHVEFDIEVNREGGVSFAGLMTCDSVWACPCCASRISREDRANALRVTRDFMGKGYTVLMVMGSVPHRRGDTLEDVQDRRLRPVLKRTLARLGREFKGRGYIRTIEHTLDISGRGNGAHPHSHGLIFAPPGIMPAKICERWKKIWIEEAKRIGLEIDPRAIGAQQATSPEAAALYVTKGAEPIVSAKCVATGAEYGAVNEVVMGQVTKKGRNGRVTPFELLELIHELRRQQRQAANQRLNRTDWRRLVRYEELYRKYAAATHGKLRRIQASAGIKLKQEAEQGGDRQPELGIEPLAHIRAEALRQVRDRLHDLRDVIKAAPAEGRYTALWQHCVVTLGVRHDWIRPGSGAQPQDRPAGLGNGPPPRPGETLCAAAHRAANDSGIPNATPQRLAWVREYLARYGPEAA